MTPHDIGIAMFAGMAVLLLARVPVGVAMLVAGGTGYVASTGWSPLLNRLKTLPISRVSSCTLSVIPLFLAMGEFATKWE